VQSTTYRYASESLLEKWARRNVDGSRISDTPTQGGEEVWDAAERGLQRESSGGGSVSLTEKVNPVSSSGFWGMSRQLEASLSEAFEDALAFEECAGIQETRQLNKKLEHEFKHGEEAIASAISSSVAQALGSSNQHIPNSGTTSHVSLFAAAAAREVAKARDLFQRASLRVISSAAAAQASEAVGAAEEAMDFRESTRTKEFSLTLRRALESERVRGEGEKKEAVEEARRSTEASCERRWKERCEEARREGEERGREAVTRHLNELHRGTLAAAQSAWARDMEGALPGVLREALDRARGEAEREAAEAREIHTAELSSLRSELENAREVIERAKYSAASRLGDIEKARATGVAEGRAGAATELATALAEVARLKEEEGLWASRVRAQIESATGTLAGELESEINRRVMTGLEKSKEEAALAVEHFRAALAAAQEKASIELAKSRDVAARDIELLREEREAREKLHSATQAELNGKVGHLSEEISLMTSKLQTAEASSLAERNKCASLSLELASAEKRAADANSALSLSREEVINTDKLRKESDDRHAQEASQWKSERGALEAALRALENELQSARTRAIQASTVSIEEREAIRASHDASTASLVESYEGKVTALQMSLESVTGMLKEKTLALEGAREDKSASKAALVECEGKLSTQSALLKLREAELSQAAASAEVGEVELRECKISLSAALRAVTVAQNERDEALSRAHAAETAIDTTCASLKTAHARDISRLESAHDEELLELRTSLRLETARATSTLHELGVVGERLTEALKALASAKRDCDHHQTRAEAAEDALEGVKKHLKSAAKMEREKLQREHEEEIVDVLLTARAEVKKIAARADAEAQWAMQIERESGLDGVCGDSALSGGDIGTGSDVGSDGLGGGEEPPVGERLEALRLSFSAEVEKTKSSLVKHKRLAKAEIEELRCILATERSSRERMETALKEATELRETVQAQLTVMTQRSEDLQRFKSAAISSEQAFTKQLSDLKGNLDEERKQRARDLEENAAALSEASAGTKIVIHERDSLLVKLSAALTREKVEENESHKKINELESRCSSLESELVAANRNFAEMEASLERKLTESYMARDTTEGALGDLTGRYSAIEKLLASTSSEAQAKVRDLEADVEALKSKLEVLSGEALANEDAKSRSEDRLALEEKLIIAMGAERAAIEAQRASEARCTALESEVAELSRIRESLSLLESQTATLEKELIEATLLLEKFKVDSNNWQKKAETAEEAYERENLAFKNADMALRSQGEEVTKLRSSLLREQESFSDARKTLEENHRRELDMALRNQGEELAKLRSSLLREQESFSDARKTLEENHRRELDMALRNQGEEVANLRAALLREQESSSAARKTLEENHRREIVASEAQAREEAVSIWKREAFSLIRKLEAAQQAISTKRVGISVERTLSELSSGLVEGPEYTATPLNHTAVSSLVPLSRAFLSLMMEVTENRAAEAKQDYDGHERDWKRKLEMSQSRASDLELVVLKMKQCEVTLNEQIDELQAKVRTHESNAAMFQKEKTDISGRLRAIEEELRKSKVRMGEEEALSRKREETLKVQLSARESELRGLLSSVNEEKEKAWVAENRVRALGVDLTARESEIRATERALGEEKEKVRAAERRLVAMEAELTAKQSEVSDVARSVSVEVERTKIAENKTRILESELAARQSRLDDMALSLEEVKEKVRASEKREAELEALLLDSRKLASEAERRASKVLNESQAALPLTAAKPTPPDPAVTIYSSNKSTGLRAGETWLPQTLGSEMPSVGEDSSSLQQLSYLNSSVASSGSGGGTTSYPRMSRRESIQQQQQQQSNSSSPAAPSSSLSPKDLLTDSALLSRELESARDEIATLYERLHEAVRTIAVLQEGTVGSRIDFEGSETEEYLGSSPTGEGTVSGHHIPSSVLEQSMDVINAAMSVGEGRPRPSTGTPVSTPSKRVSVSRHQSPQTAFSSSPRSQLVHLASSELKEAIGNLNSEIGVGQAVQTLNHVLGLINQLQKSPNKSER